MKNRGNQKNNAAYGLRENPKKSLRLSPSNCDPSHPLPDKNISCKICSKAFLTRRQLCGHLRHHSIGEHRWNLCRQCGKRFGTIRALCGHMKSHSEGGGIRALDEVTDCSVFLIGNGVRKRARTPRFEISEIPQFDSALKEEKDGFDVSELEEVAISLIMLSEGLEFSAAADVSVNAVDDDLNLELVESLKNDDGFNNLKLEAVEISSNFSDKLTQGKLSSEMTFEAVGMGSSYSGYVKQGKLSSEMELDASNDTGELITVEIDLRVKDESFVGEQESREVHNSSSDLISDSAKPEDDMLKYRCISCNRGFNSHQALGGHRSSKHKLRRCSFRLKTETCRSSIQAPTGKPECAADDVKKDEHFSDSIEKFEPLKRCNNKCALCFKVFWSVKALQGHMRAHQPGSMEETSGVEVDMSSHSPVVF